MWSWLTGEPPYPFVRKVVVHTKTDHSFRCVLWRRTGPFLVLRQVESLLAGGTVKPIDGELVIEERDVDFIQVLDTGSV
jgi:hypothetical protein